MNDHFHVTAVLPRKKSAKGTRTGLDVSGEKVNCLCRNSIPGPTKVLNTDRGKRLFSSPKPPDRELKS